MRDLDGQATGPFARLLVEYSGTAEPPVVNLTISSPVATVSEPIEIFTNVLGGRTR